MINNNHYKYTFLFKHINIFNKIYRENDLFSLVEMNFTKNLTKISIFKKKLFLKTNLMMKNPFEISF